MPQNKPPVALYFHIPFCIQKCKYCDFATERVDQLDEIQTYVNIICEEIKKKSELLNKFQPQTIYFGGGTPSLLTPTQLDQIINTLYKNVDGSAVEDFTLEANPSTLDETKFLSYKKIGVNRFSLGAQTFNDKKLAAIGREHDSASTITTLELLSSHQFNYSLDLLYTLPNQTLQDLKFDLEIIKKYSPPHVSAYILTLADSHELNRGRPADDIQERMYYEVNSALASLGLYPYEISNYAKPGYESKHNQFYWQFKSYIGFGRSAHSFLFPYKDWGIRFWNPYSIKSYFDYVKDLNWHEEFYLKHPEKHFELLQQHESMTDFCYTALRTSRGLNGNDFASLFGHENLKLVQGRLDPHIATGLVKFENNILSLTPKGTLLSNVVFADLSFS